jgi:uncharacterized protein (DUF1697 family)
MTPSSKGARSAKPAGGSLTTWVALLRGINVGGNNRLPMRDLAAILVDVGARDVSTYIQSGNAVFTADAGDGRDLATRIGEAIGERHGFVPHVLLVTADALQRAIEANPFREAESEPRTLHLFFLDTPPRAPDLDGLEAVRGPTERFALDGAVLYLHLPDGLGRSKLALKAERLLGVPATARNWTTVTKVAELAESAALER